MDPIVVGSDGSAGAEAAVKKVIELAGGSGVTVHLAVSYTHLTLPTTERV